MASKQLIKSATVYAVTLLLAGTVMAITRRDTSEPISQNQNSSSRTKGFHSAENMNARDERMGAAAISSQDQKFIMDAAMGGMMEVELGRLAMQNGSSDSIKEFGRRMVDHYSAANKELMELASSIGVAVPTELDRKHRNHVTKMAKLTGPAFDRAYAKAMLRDHTTDVTAFGKQSAGNDGNAEIKAFAHKALPTLREHLEMTIVLGLITTI